jgi:hypothetical protein
VCSAIATGAGAASSGVMAASARAPASASDAAPERYRAPPTVTCTMPSEPASAKPRTAALSVCDDVTLIAGKA